MAKKRTYPGAGRKKVSVKKIVESIEKVLDEIESSRSRAAAATPSREIERARKALLAARAAVESACLPEFFVPSE
jgi:hypothetical protein